MSPDDPSSLPADVAEDPELSPGSHTPPSDLPALQDEEAPEGENHATQIPSLTLNPSLTLTPMAIAAKAEKLKEQGNDSFKHERYGDATDLYSKAIGLFPSSSLYLFLIHDIPPRSGLHRTSLPHEPRSGLHCPQVLLPCPRQLPTHHLPPIATLRQCDSCFSK